MLHPKQINYTSLTVDQRRMAVQRLTALWALCESGLGGILHAFQFPFTGLFIGGFAVIIITLITKFSAQRPYQVFQSLVVVLAIKAMVSPYSPVTAYLAVSFQGLMGFVFYRLLHVNVVSIVLVAVITMLESAVQKLLVLTFFFGQSFWKAVDDMTDFITNQMGVSAVNGSRWVITLYLSVYLAVRHQEEPGQRIGGSRRVEDRPHAVCVHAGDGVCDGRQQVRDPQAVQRLQRAVL